MKTPIKKFFILLLVVSGMLIGCKKENSLDVIQSLKENLVVGNSQLIEGDIPIPPGEKEKWEVDSIIEIVNESGVFTLKANASKPISVLLIQIEGMDSYFQVVYKENGEYAFARKEDAKIIEERVVRMGLFLPKNNKLPEKFEVKANVTGIIGFDFGWNSSPTRDELMRVNFDRWLNPSNVVLTINSRSISFTCGNKLVDRQLNVYGTVQIGSQCWMAENLRYEVPATSKCYEDNPENCNIYGRLYRLSAAKIACPRGWHLPSDEEWKKMERQIGMSSTDANMTGFRGINLGSKIAGQIELWNSGVLKSNLNFGSIGFNGIPGGRMNSRTFSMDKDMQAWWWTSNETFPSNPNIPSSVVVRSIEYNNNGIYRATNLESLDYLSCRCVKN